MKVQAYKVKKGEVTAFLSLVFVLILAFITSILNSAMVQTTKSTKRQEVDRALFSLFGEYDPVLFEVYDIFATDTGQPGDGEYAQVKNRLQYYGVRDIKQEISGIQFLTDRMGAAFKEQAIEYMAYTYGISSVQDFVGMTKEWEKVEIAGNNIKNQNETFDQQFTEIASKENGKESFEFVEEMQKLPLLSSVLPANYQCSTKTVEQQQLFSQRKHNVGKGEFYIRSDLSSLQNKLLFREYLLEKFTNALSSNDKLESKQLSYEVEYLIGGKNSDQSNLEVVLKRIALLRTGANYIFLLNDPKKKAEVETMATVLSALILCPEGIEVISQILLIVWAFAESVQDLKILMNGHKIPLLKTPDQWSVSLNSVIHRQPPTNISSPIEQENGLGYKDYLRILLFFKTTDTLTAKAFDRIEGNLRLAHEEANISLDTYMTKVRCMNQATIHPGVLYDFPAYFGYN